MNLNEGISDGLQLVQSLSSTQGFLSSFGKLNLPTHPFSVF
jgi:hypothetical protein